MKVNSTNKRNISFDSLWSNKYIKKGLEFASNNGALFAATTTLGLSTGVRTLSILATPKAKKENKKIACAKSITSGCIEFILTLAISVPIAAAFKKIDANPTKYLKESTVKALKDSCSDIKESKVYSLATQLFKLGLGFAVIFPKAILTSTGIPFMLKNSSNSSKNEEIKSQSLIFRGKCNETLAKGIGKLLDSKSLQDFANKYKNSNFPLHIFALKDICATFAFINEAKKNKKIKEDQKPFLINNSIISTALSLISGYTVDKLTNKQCQKIIETIKKENFNDPKLAKYIEGFKIIKPITILAIIYYVFIPTLSTFLADKSKNYNSSANLQ